MDGGELEKRDLTSLYLAMDLIAISLVWKCVGGGGGGGCGGHCGNIFVVVVVAD